jgi:hypothetical protein
MQAFQADKSEPTGESSMFVDEVNKKCDSKVLERLPKRWRWVAMMVLGSSLVSSIGCTAWTGAQQAWQYNHYWNDSIMGYRHTCMASKAWHSRKHCYANQQYMKDFARGFKAGYMAVAAGGDGCTPAFPPREYWGWKYQSCEGQARVAAWFSGFPYGAQAAEQDGIGGWTQIQSSKGIQNQYVQHGHMPSEYNGMYPVPPIDPRFQATPTSQVPAAEVIENSILESDDRVYPESPVAFPAVDPVVPNLDPTIQ